MNHEFQQQSSGRNLNFSNSAPTPQHGAKGDPETLKREERRVFAAKPQQQH
jgi:hypothetical protein